MKKKRYSKSKKNNKIFGIKRVNERKFEKNKIYF